MKIKSEDKTEYCAHKPEISADDQEVIRHAMEILLNRMREPGEAIANPEDVKTYLKLKLTEQEKEVFACLFLDNRHRVIEYNEMFFGTINGASVHPREIVKQALKVNAAAVIFSHNHPSGVSEPSEADKQLTRKLSEVLAVLDIRVLDHIIIGHYELTSFAERGLL